MYKRYHCNQIHVISQSDMATWPPLQHNWPWPLAIYQTIKTISIGFPTLAIFSRITNVDRLSRPVESRKSVVRVQRCIRAVRTVCMASYLAMLCAYTETIHISFMWYTASMYSCAWYLFTVTHEAVLLAKCFYQTRLSNFADRESCTCSITCVLWTHWDYS